MEWTLITSHEQLDELLNESNNHAVLIFKHSTRCAISRMALRQFENNFDYEGKIAPYFLDLLQYRNLSNEIAERFNVQHQSPQLLVIRDGEAVYNTSHEHIDAEVLGKFI